MLKDCRHEAGLMDGQAFAGAGKEVMNMYIINDHV